MKGIYMTVSEQKVFESNKQKCCGILDNEFISKSFDLQENPGYSGAIR